MALYHIVFTLHYIYIP